MFRNRPVFKLEILSDKKRRQEQLHVILLVTGHVLLGMTALNFFVARHPLATTTALSSVGFYLLYLLSTKAKYNGPLLYVCIFFLTLWMFNCFIITGGVEGFSFLWILLVAVLAFPLFGIRGGLLFSLVFFFDLSFFFYVPAGRAFLQYPYSDAFLQRTPLAYLTFALISLYLELVRKKTYDALLSSNDRLLHLSTHDPLTHLFNRQAFSGAATFAFSDRAKKPAALLMIDFDFFKSVNDTYGHMAGDTVLRESAQRIATILPRNGWGFRMGGEEFAILLTGNIAKNYQDIAYRMRVSIANTPFCVEKHRIPVTVSIGGVYAKNATGSDLPRLLKEADQALYAAKKAGRNACICRTLSNQTPTQAGSISHTITNA